MISDKPGNISFGKKIMNVTTKQYGFKFRLLNLNLMSKVAFLQNDSIKFQLLF